MSNLFEGYLKLTGPALSKSSNPSGPIELWVPILFGIEFIK
jgi:hypothetical protein